MQFSFLLVILAALSLAAAGCISASQPQATPGGPNATTIGNTVGSCFPYSLTNSEPVLESNPALFGFANSQIEGKTTVAQKLTELGASCTNGKLLDASGKQIFFYRRQTVCQGVAPPEGLYDRQNAEIQKLNETYAVMELHLEDCGNVP
ncbi:TPA: hypothetical protein HA244_06855 [Candidatus Micrarchaeota archaeon]|nr:hypothetical protein [Candidatus Micrarchaeota archaeon]